MSVSDFSRVIQVTDPYGPAHSLLCESAAYAFTAYVTAIGLHACTALLIPSRSQWPCICRKTLKMKFTYSCKKSVKVTKSCQMSALGSLYGVSIQELHQHPCRNRSFDLQVGVQVDPRTGSIRERVRERQRARALPATRFLFTFVVGLLEVFR